MSDLVYEDEFVKLWCGDGVSWLHNYCGGADAVVTDPT